MMDAATRLDDVLRLANAWQKRAGDGDLLTLMRAAEVPPGPWSASRRWRQTILRTQVEPVYRAIIAARTQQRAPSEATHAVILMWFAALWPVDPQAGEAFGGWPRPVLYPLTGWRGIPRPPKSKKEKAA